LIQLAGIQPDVLPRADARASPSLFIPCDFPAPCASASSTNARTAALR